MEKAEENKHLILVYALILTLLLFAISAYYVSNQDRSFRDSSLIGDGVCGNLPSVATRDACCLKIHEDDSESDCFGGWKYVDALKECQYVCQGDLPKCPGDEKSCGDGSVVFRDASRGCEFSECRS